MNYYKGSSWAKWDLHVHTPDSLVSGYGGDWDKFITDIENLPPEFKVIGINDYIFIEGYRRVLEEKAKGRFPNIDLFLPVIELRVDKFGGSKSKMSKINYHIIFSNEVTPDVIQAQFLSALATAYQVMPQYDSIAGNGKWNALPTKESLSELGELIISSVPDDQKAHFGGALQEGFNNFCVNFDKLTEILARPHFEGKFLTAVGKTEWADIKWNDQSIADKKNIINQTDLVFISSAKIPHYFKARESLTQSNVNDRLLDCSDAHIFSDSDNKDRIGKCFSWIKADCSFEGLRQALYEFDGRVQINESEPISPPLRISNVSFSFPDDTVILAGEHRDTFCFSGEHSFNFSPYLTCVIGGRGSGKSTLINLIHESFKPGTNAFFKTNKIELGSGNFEDYVSIDSSVTAEQIEFLGQNSIEQFATSSKVFSEAIFSRLMKLESGKDITAIRQETDNCLKTLEVCREDIISLYDAKRNLKNKQNELAANQKIVASYQSDQYTELTLKVSETSNKIQINNKWKSLTSDLTESLKLLIQKSKATNLNNEDNNSFGSRYISAIKRLEETLRQLESPEDVQEALVEEKEVITLLESSREALDEYLASKGLSRENLVDVSNTQDSLSRLNQELPDLQAYIAMLEDKIESNSIDRKFIDDYKTLITQSLTTVNSQLENVSEEVKTINLTFDWDMKLLFSELVEHICQEVNENTLDNNIRSHNIARAFEGFDFTAIKSKEMLLEKVAGDGVTTSTLRTFFESESNFQTLLIDIELALFNVEKYGKINVFYDGKPIQNTSFGQRCTAAIVALVMLGNTPIIIDEPEAHLDSNLIAKYLVELVKTVKKNRQIIFATHNANFVVNGDSELIHILTMSDSKVTNSCETSIENMDYREQLLSLEGGTDAFRKREKKYFPQAVMG